MRAQGARSTPVGSVRLFPISDQTRCTDACWGLGLITDAPAVAASSQTRGGFRPDIEGLRALAVVLVILDHLFGWPRGGFIGVDVFFVISGFLITGLLLREKATSGTISIREFYARRMRRIFPLATLVLVLTVAASFLLWVPERAIATLWDAVWAFFFLSNWHFAAVGTDYFHATDAISPVQQYWSLSIEEQFYFVWPGLLLLTWWLTTRRAGKAGAPAASTRRSPAVVISMIVLASLAWSVWLTTDNQTQAYFSTFTRAFELGAGALLAIVASRISPGRMTRAVMLYIGVLVIAAGALLLGPASPFPGLLAMIPVAGTLMVIASGIGSSAPGQALLANPVAGFLGRISYSLYLWHWPLIILTFSVVDQSWWTDLIVLEAVFLISVVSYSFVEVPVRRSRWLSAPGVRPQAQATRGH